MYLELSKVAFIERDVLTSGVAFMRSSTVVNTIQNISEWGSD